MTEEQHIQKGFNHGYQLQKLQPELAQSVKEGLSDKDHPYAKGFLAGAQEYSREKENEKSSYQPDLGPKRQSKSQDKSQKDKGFEL